MQAENADQYKLSKGYSTVKLEIDVKVLMDIFNLLNTNDRKDLIERIWLIDIWRESHKI
jgi:hypothetical protein